MLGLDVPVEVLGRAKCFFNQVGSFDTSIDNINVGVKHLTEELH